jgi:hypothetical protein
MMFRQQLSQGSGRNIASVWWRIDSQPENRLRRSKRVEFDVRRSDKKKDNGLNTGFDEIDLSSSKL